MQLAQTMALDEQYYLQVFGKRTPVAFQSGQGCVLTATDGRQYLDFLAGIAVTSLGHCHPAVTAAIAQQAGTLLHCSNLYYIEQQAQLAQLLVENSSLDRVFFCNSGAEANEAALKLARKFFYAQGQNKFEIITAGNSFHGRTLATVAATGQPKYQAPYAPLTPGFIHVPYNDMASLENAITPHTCAIMLETIQGEGGVIEASAQYLQHAQALCAQHGLLFILDEVQTGMGRTGKLLSYEHFQLAPHIITLAKALGNGVPIGAVLCTQPVADQMHIGDHGSTYGGNPLACAAALAVTNVMLETDLLARCRQLGANFKAQLLALAARYPAHIIDVRGRGLLLGAQLAPGIDGKQVVAAAFEKGLLMNCAGQNTLRFAPPLVVSQAQIDTCISTLSSVLAAQ